MRDWNVPAPRSCMVWVCSTTKVSKETHFTNKSNTKPYYCYQCNASYSHRNCIMNAYDGRDAIGIWCFFVRCSENELHFYMFSNVRLSDFEADPFRFREKCHFKWILVCLCRALVSTAGRNELAALFLICRANVRSRIRSVGNSITGCCKNIDRQKQQK